MRYELDKKWRNLIDVDVVVKQAQAYGLYARLFLLFNIIYY